jgi:hypothetical protein
VGRRTLVILLLAAAVGLPAGILRAGCVGKSCRLESDAAAAVPFCSLPESLRAGLVTGFRERRSPEVLAVAGPAGIVGGDASDLPWPSLEDPVHHVPILFHGAGVDGDAEIPPATALDDIAPTIAEIIGLRRPHPEVRSGRAIPHIATGESPRLVLEVILKGVGSSDLDGAGWPHYKRLARAGAERRYASSAGLPVEPSAVQTTIGTGGEPRQHGITGPLVRNDSGKLVHAWGRGSPVSVIATLGDDLDQKLHNDPLIGMVAAEDGDRGAIGGNWYVEVDRDDFLVELREPAAAARRLLEKGYGRDDVPDLMVASLQGPRRKMDDALGDIEAAARIAAGGSLATVVTATGSAPVQPGTIPAGELVTRLSRRLGADVVEAATPGGLFIDQSAISTKQITEDEVIEELRGLRGPDGKRLVADAFSAIAVSFARYC